MMERLYFGNVCSRADLIDEHIKRHSLNLDRVGYLQIADTASTLDSTDSGPVNFLYGDRRYSVVLNGVIESEGNKYRVVRSVVCKGRPKEDFVYSGYGIKVRVIGKRQPTYIPPDLPEWSSVSIQDAIGKLEGDQTIQGTYRYEIPVPHFVRLHRKFA